MDESLPETDDEKQARPAFQSWQDRQLRASDPPRLDNGLRIGRATFAFKAHPGFVHLDGRVTAVEATSLDELDSEHVAGLRNHYPAMPNVSPLSRIHFDIEHRRST